MNSFKVIIKIVRQCIMYTTSNTNTLMLYEMPYYRSMYGIDICYADMIFCLLRAKPLCLTPDQHAHVILIIIIFI